MYNKVILVGRISTDLELRFTSNNKPYCRFTIAVNRISEGTDFIPVTVWNRQAENLVEFQNKGSLILVDGSINMNVYEDKDGNKRTSFEIMAQSIQFLKSRKDNQTNNDNSEELNSDNDVYEQFGEQLNIDDSFLDD